MRFENETDAVTYIFDSLAKTDWRTRGLDEHTRDVAPTRRLLEMHHLLDNNRREYAVVTGSKGKGSVTVFTAKLLHSLGHTVGTITSPHLVSYRERIRVNGRAIPLEDFLRLVDELAPSIDAIQASLPTGRYLSPQGIFLAMALRWFDEQEVSAAVIEVGRGGRFDDNALVPNMLSMFTPIILEHARYLGPTVERIAWHKAGIIKPRSYVYSLPQSPEVMDILRAEAEGVQAEFDWVAPTDIGEYIGSTDTGIHMRLGRYGDINLPMFGKYEIDNATLAVWGAGNMHARLSGIPHGSQEYVERIRHGLENVVWAGRCQKLQEHPTVFIDGAINTMSVNLFLDSVKPHLTDPVVVVAAVPLDRDYPGVYAQLAPVGKTLILTQTERNITIKFPDENTALSTANAIIQERGLDTELLYAPDVPAAIELAKVKAGHNGTVLMAVAQPAIGDAMLHYGLFYEQI